MSKEILEQMTHDYKNAFPINIEWLLEYAKEQAERVKELEIANFELLEALRFQDEDLERENKRYREVLQFYGNKNNYLKHVGMQPITPTIEIDSGKKAREILKNS